MTVAERLTLWFQNIMNYESMRYGMLQISARSIGDAGKPETQWLGKKEKMKGGGKGRERQKEKKKRNT
jgi:hypothetical protein